ncbi:MAG: type ISP restriction/modification enzyme [Bacteroidales bacterium]|nr:type ISP restriction/modification enzyme [Bacteroidales bacterium]
MIKDYLEKITKTTTRGDAREESYYPHFSHFLLDFAISTGKLKTQITTLPKKTEAGNPDFRVWDGKENIIGYVEAKKPGENLDIIERSEQLKRYLKTFPNVILTDFYEFRLYRKGEMVDKTFVARSALAKKGIPPPIENEAKFTVLLSKFFAFSLPKVTTAEQLGKELAIRTRFLRDEVITVEMEQQQKGKGELYGFFETFKKFLIANLTEKDFADLFSQTITYGLFAARTRSANGFNRKLAYDLIPKTIGILRNVFKFISQGDLPKHMEVMVDDIAEVLNAADVRNILHGYFKAGKGEDPIVHFYETFLSEYDPATREKRGVYYTPEPVVRYIVRSVHDILKTRFNLNDGLASKEVTLLDPAGGTLTFPAEAIKLAVHEYTAKYGEGGVNKLLSEHILKDFYAFELMMAPYAIGHIKMSFLLEELGYTMKDNERFKLYLTNTLDIEDLSQTQIPGLESLSDESHEAGRIKKEESILVIMGNPPYSGISANKNEWTERLLKSNIDGAQSYYEIDGKKLEEKKLWLQDDYVKFLRFAQWKIHKAGLGVVGMITNHSYLDNPTFRGMRQSLMNTFNEIYILDLHGNSLKKETSPNGARDENVFDIQQGVAIALFIKREKAKGCKIYHSDLFGERENKYIWLDKHSLKKKDFIQLKPESPWYFFIRRNTKDIEHYNNWMRVNEIFPVNTVGFVTGRDSLTIGFEPIELWNRLSQFSRFDTEFARQAYTLGKDSRDWKVENAQQDIRESGPIKGLLKRVLYRPLDIRFTYYTGMSRGLFSSPQHAIMQHLLKENLGLAIGRQGQVVGDDHLWNLAFISNKIIDFNLFYRGGELFLPLYLYKPEEKKKKGGFQSMMLFESETEYGSEGRKPNISSVVFEQLEKVYKKKPTPEQILFYCYSVLYSNIYREKYAEFLKIDFPRVPFTGIHTLFLQMAELGEELTQLHLLKSKSLNNPIVKYKGLGEDLIVKPVYNEANRCVFINATKYFEGIEPEMWNYHIGGYQVLEKYLKDRKGRQMTDPATYCKIATSIAKTIEIQQKIDLVYTEIETKELIT